MQMLQAAPSRHRCLRLSSSTVWRTSCLATERFSQWAQFIDRVVDTRSTETVTHSAICGNTEEITQVQSFDKVDMALAVRDQSRQRRTLLMFRVFCFLIE